MEFGNLRGRLEIRNGAGDFNDLEVRASGKVKGSGGGFE